MNVNLGWLQDATNERVLDAIRYEASGDYQRRIPEAAQVGVQRVLKELGEYKPVWNEFESALVNKIGATIGRTQSWTNPLAQFKHGMLEFGDTIEEVEVGLLRAYNIDPQVDYGEKMLFGRELPEVQSNYHRVNRKDMYKFTTNETMLKRAFLNDGGLGAYVSKLMLTPIKSDNWDEFLLMCQLFPEYDNNGGFFRVNVPDITGDNPTQEDVRTNLRRIRGVAETITFISTRYNAAHMPVFADLDDLVLFCTPEYRAAMDVDALAAAFNMERADVPSRIITVPKERFDIDGAQAILTTKDFFIVADVEMANESLYNPVNRHTNYFWHHAQIISASRFVPAVVFTTLPGTDVVEIMPEVTGITALTVTDVDNQTVTTVAPGMIYSVTPSITTTPADALDWWRLGIRLVLSGNTSPRTFLSDSGTLRLSGSEAADKLTITAFAVENEAVTFSADVTVGEDTVPVWPVTESAPTPTP